MGATTKSGRTRNRRGIPPSNPPTGWPQLITLLLVDYTSATQVSFEARWPGGTDWGASGVNGGGAVQIWITGETGTFPATLVWDAGENLFFLNHAEPIGASTVWGLMPWQEGARGPNGEWFAPFCALSP